MTRLATPICALLLLAGVPASAVDGVLEINQTCAVNTGCFTGDTAGFPVNISATMPAVSVRLTSSLVVPDANTAAITINGSDVSVDLNGFEIRGPTSCSGVPIACSPTGSGVGIFSGGDGITIVNGSIRGMGGNGIQLNGPASRIENVRVSSNGAIGIRTAGRGLVARCVAFQNGNSGILADLSVIRDSVASSNGNYGIDSFTSTIIGNSMRSNENVGLNASTDTGYGHNNFSGNNGGDANPQVASGLQIAPNVCGGDLVCP